MDMHLLKTANSFAIAYRRVFGERVAISVLDDKAAAKALIDKAMASSDKELLAAAGEVATAFGIAVAPPPKPAQAPKPAPVAAAPKPAGKITEAQWSVIEGAAVKIGGPICMVLVGQLRDEAPETFAAAVEILAERIGGGTMGIDFRKEVQAASVKR